jgi:peptidoglycan LD-endopeptidase LytH
MRRVSILLVGFLLAACTAPSPFYTPTVSRHIPLQPTSTFAFSVLPASPCSYPTSASILTQTPLEFPTETSTEKPANTEVSFDHVFPLQPPDAAGFAEGTSSHGYPATDIFAVVGTKFVAVTDGVVDFVSYEDVWEPEQDEPALRGGLSVAIIGKDGLRYYGSHLSAIAPGISPGVSVTTGQLLGLVGNTGDARSTTSHLHFGISRPSTSDDWKARRGQIDPFPFLIAWRDGHNITPPLPDPPSTSTPTLYPHMFPIQPPSLAGFSPGGHPYPATDIFAPLGTKFVAVTSGVVDEVSSVDQWDPLINDNATAGGLSVRIIGDDGLRYYGAHLSKIAAGILPGVWVPAGQILGLVGNSGNARTSNSHLHFEISSPVPPFIKVDPFPILVDWLGGQNVMPTLPEP